MRKDMASAGSFLYEEHLECSVCTELFDNPVSLPCGHNFCKSCISKHWIHKELLWCPLCKQEFNKSLKLCVNTVFRDIVEHYKQDHALEDSEKVCSPDDVLCDCCLHTRRRALKTCLVCLTSFCRSHLQRHLKQKSLKTHTLTDPLPKPEENMCTKHRGVLEVTDTSAVLCLLCANTDTQSLPEKKDLQYIKINNSKKSKKSKSLKAALNKKTEDEETESLGDFDLYFEGQLYTFSPLPLDQGFSRGRVYYNVEIKTNSSWELGVVSAKMRGKTFICLNSKCAWVVCVDRHCRCTVGCPLDSTNIPERVYICVNYEHRLMFIYHVPDRKVIFCYTNCEFRGKLVLFFRQSQRRAPITPQKKGQKISYCKVLIFCIAFGFFVLFIANVLWHTAFFP